MMREDRVMQCAGYAIWNKEDHKTPGRRFKDRSEWVWVERAHPAIITVEEAKQVVSLNQSRGGRTSFRHTEHSQYMLTGKNAFGDDMFVCTKCGARMTGYQPSARHRLQYRCGSVHYRGSSSCIGKPIDKDWVEDVLFNQIKKTFGTPKAAMEVANRVNKQMEAEGTVNSKASNQLERRLTDIEKQIKNLVKAVASGMDISEIHDEMQQLKQEKSELAATLENIKNEDRLRPQTVSAKQILNLFSELSEAIKTGTNEQKRTLLRAFVRRLEFDPENDALQISMYTDPTQSTVWYLSGAQDRTCFEWHILEPSKQRSKRKSISIPT
jgi:site-specific DNA recombinase